MAKPTIKRVKLTDLKFDPNNANLGTERGVAVLNTSLSELGAGRSLLADKDLEIIAGNNTLERAIDLGFEDAIVVESDGKSLVVVQRTDLDLDNEEDPRAVRMGLFDNRSSEVGLQWAAETLVALADKYGDDIRAGLWGDDEWNESIVSEVIKRESAERDIPERSAEFDGLVEKWATARGQLWTIPSVSMPGVTHRLYCGDSTNPEDVKIAMGGGLAHLLITSPPYWVGMSYETQKDESEIDRFITACVQSWTDFVGVDYGRIIINTGTAAIHRVDQKRKIEVLPLVDKWQAALRQRGWLARNIRIWAKSGDLPATIGPSSDVVDQHWESFIEFDHEENPINQFEYLATFWSPAGDQRGQERADSSWAQQGVWSDVAGEASAGGAHVAAFPIEIPRRFVLLYSKPGEIVIDPFMGSCTTLLACELTKRSCVGLEIGPGYLAAGLERLAEFGLAPELAGVYVGQAEVERAE